MAANQLKIGAFGIWVQNQKVLVAQRLITGDPHKSSGEQLEMGFPGNTVNVGQTPVQVIENSLLNQTGAEVSVSKIIFASEKFHIDSHDSDSQLIHLYYKICDSSLTSHAPWDSHSEARQNPEKQKFVAHSASTVHSSPTSDAWLLQDNVHNTKKLKNKAINDLMRSCSNFKSKIAYKGLASWTIKFGIPSLIEKTNLHAVQVNLLFSGS